MPLRIRTKIDYSGCQPFPQRTVLAERIDNRGRNRGAIWSEAEKARLRELCQKMTVKQAAEFFPTRTAGAVSHMASFMGLVRKP